MTPDQKSVATKYSQLYDGITFLGTKLLEGQRQDLSVEQRQVLIDRAHNALTELYNSFPLPDEDKFRELMLARWGAAQARPGYPELQQAWQNVLLDLVDDDKRRERLL